MVQDPAASRAILFAAHDAAVRRYAAVRFVIVLFGWLPCPRSTRIARSWAREPVAGSRKPLRSRLTRRGPENIPRGQSRVDVEALLRVGNDRADGRLPAAGVGAEARADVDPAGRLGRRRCCKPIAIDRKAGATAVKQVVEQGKQRLPKACGFSSSPKAREWPPGETRKYGVSGALLASKAGCKIIPVAHNAGYYWPRRGC